MLADCDTDFCEVVGFSMLPPSRADDDLAEMWAECDGVVGEESSSSDASGFSSDACTTSTPSFVKRE